MIVFLDIDGVLNSHAWRLGTGDKSVLKGIDPAAVAMLNPLVQAGVRFVLSSTWREMFDGPGMTTYLRPAGFTGDIIDRTELDGFERSPGGLIARSKTRGQQVADWVEAHPDCGPFVILDDDGGPDYWAPVYDRLVLTTFEAGLQPEHVTRALAMLHGS